MNPFKKGTIRGADFFAVSADDRIYMVKNFTMLQCVAAIRLPTVLQKTVRKAIRRRLEELKNQQPGKTRPVRKA